ncbi:hypothetical protein RB195_023578 [Necator americanus]|uniref:Uncharacterized protein n=1 Tax=Necator americanus TaxID=51031 RepID=A0ABR1EJR4_NECAM
MKILQFNRRLTTWVEQHWILHLIGRSGVEDVQSPMKCGNKHSLNVNSKRLSTKIEQKADGLFHIGKTS